MKHWRKGLKRITAVALAVMMIGTTVDASALAVLAAEEVTEVTCNHVCDETCGGMQAVTGSALSVCTHVHDEECGYEEAEAECTCGTDDPAFHATNCPAYIAPENPQCTCVEKCTDDTLNVWCDVCGVQGVSACQGDFDSATSFASTTTVFSNKACGASTNEGGAESVTCTFVWDFTDTNNKFGILTISGSGAMADSTPYWARSGYDYRTPEGNDRGRTINKVIVEEGVTHIGQQAFYGCTYLTSVSLPSTLESIGNLAFTDCPIETIDIPSGVTSIGKSAFNGCSNLTSITIPEGVKYIESQAFQECSSLTSVTIPDGVIQIGMYAFVDCAGLQTVSIPSSIQSIENYAFKGCTSLTTVNVPCSWENNPLYTFEEGVTVNIADHNRNANGACIVCKDGYATEPNIVSSTHYPELNDTHSGYYAIETMEQLCWFSDYVNKGNTSVNAVLTDDIVAGANDIWTPIGNNTNIYAGTFDGNNHTINGLYTNNEQASYVGLFGTISGTVKNVGVTNVSFTGTYSVGGVCGDNYGTIQNCYSTGSISNGDQSAGGVCGYNGGTIQNCYSECTVEGASFVGGVCGYNNGTIQNCYSTGSISNGDQNAGGVCGINNSSITNCYYLNGTYWTGIGGDGQGTAESKTENEFNSGAVAYLLNNSTSTGNLVWYQNLSDNTDSYPVLNDTHGTVYSVYKCDGTTIYRNVNENMSHIPNYSASGDTITASCSQCSQENIGTIVISASNKYYDGTAIIATVDNSVDGTDYSSSIVYKDNTGTKVDGAVNVGIYTANLTLTNADSTEVTASCQFEIAKATPTAEMFTYIESAVYDGTEKSANVVEKDGITGIGAITNIKYYQNDIEVTPINAGTYTVKIDVADGDIYDAATDIEVGTFEITKATPTPDMFTATPSSELVYDGTEKSIIVTTDKEGMGTFTVSYVSFTDSTQPVQPVEAGLYIVLLHIEEGDNYIADDTLSFVPFEIRKVDSVITAAPTPADLVYDGTAQNLINAGTATGGEMQYSLDGTNYSSAIPTGTDAGEYTVWYKVVGDKNHNDTEPASIEVTIAKGTPDIGTVSASNMENTLDVSQVVLSRSNETVPGTLSLADGTTLQYGTKDYTYVFTPNDNINYETVTGTVSITISDTNGPTATYKVGTDGWKQFINTVTFGHFCKDYTTVDITYSDEESGVANKQYYISEEEITNAENIQWSEYTDTLNINATGKYYIYVKVTDKGGNKVIRNSEGIVVYAESVITPTSFAFEYGEENDLSVNISANGNTFANLTDGSGNEIATENYSYSIDRNELTIKGEYLSDLDVGEYTYKICMNPQGVENTEVTLAYSFVVKVTAKELTVTGATATSRDYIANDKTVDITGITLSGIQGTDDVSVEITGLKGTLSSANAGTYTSVTLPTLTLTGDDAENYVLVQPTSAVATDVTINKLNPTITVDETEYYKTFGDADFTLDITDDNPEANITYSSNDENVVTVSNGTVTIKGAGTTTITVSMGASTNYNAAVDKTVTVHVARAAYSVDTINKSYFYARSNDDSINLAELLPEDCGTVYYASVTSNGVLRFTSEDTKPKVTNGILAYTLESGAADDTGIIVVDVETQNYEDITITVNVTLTDQIPVNVDGAVELNSNVLTYGETLSGLTFKSVDFVDNAGNEVAGTLAWKEPSATPNAGTTSATWVFTPNNAAYASVEGTVAITVNKATPNVTGVPTVADRDYNPSVVLADSDLTGGTVKGVDGNSLAGSWSWKVSGTVPVVNNSGYEAVFTPVDANYETVTGTIMVTVTKATPYVATKPTASALTYGQTLNQSVLSNGVIHYSETDSTVVAGSFAWEAGTVKPAVADSNATSYIVVFTPADNTNYNKVEIQITLTVNKAENAPNMPGTTMSVPYSNKTVSAVTLPTGWEWKTEDVTKTLTIGEAVTAIALYKGTDAGNYETETVEVAITRSTCSHSGGTELKDASEASCTADGYTGDTYCKGCGARISVGQGISATGHDYNSQVTTGPTTSSEGIRTYTCENCGDSYTESIPKLPEPTPTVAPTGTPTPAPEKLPHIQDEDGKSGWDVIGDEIEKVIEDAKDSEEKAVVTVDMNGVTKVPKDIFEQIAGKDVSVEFILDNGLMWTVNGKTVNTEDLKEIDFAVTVESEENPIDSIPVKVINMVTGEWTSIEIQLAHSGEFGFEAVLTVNLEEKNAGLYANLFFYLEDIKELQFICADVIAEDGSAELTFTHASDYLIVLSDTSLEPKDEEEVPEVKEPVLVKGYTVQIGAFIKLANAEKYKIKGESLDLPMFIIKEGKYYKVQTDVYETREEAVEVAKIFSAAGLDNFILKTERLVTPGEEEIPTTPVLPTDADKKKIEAIAKEVIAGKWGNGTERKNRLTEAGYNYREVQDKVNELLK